MRLKDQVVIVTGVSHPGQVGYGLAAAFAREGAHLAISTRNTERVNARAQELQAEGASVIAIPANLTTEEGAHALVQGTLEAYGRIDILVNLVGGLTSISSWMWARALHRNGLRTPCGKPSPCRSPLPTTTCMRERNSAIMSAGSGMNGRSSSRSISSTSELCCVLAQ